MVLILFFIPILATASDYNIYTESFGCASYMSNGELNGYAIDVFKELQSRVGDDSKIVLIPWARGYLYLQKKPNAILFLTTLNKERSQMFKWVGPVSVDRSYFYARKKSKIKINSLSSAKKLKSIGCYKDDIQEQYLRSKNFKNIYCEYGKDATSQLVKKLERGALDVILVSEEVICHECDNNKFSRNDFIALYEVMKSYNYIAFSRKTPDSLIKKWQNALNSMKRDGAYRRIMLKYGLGKSAITFAKPGTM